MRLIGDGNDEVDELHYLIQMSNDLAVHALVQAGYDGKLLRATIKWKDKQPAEKTIMEPNTAACVAALAKTKTHGARFHATHGHSMSDDFLKSAKLEDCMVLQEKCKKEKKLRLQQQTLEDNAMLILERGKNVESLLVSELDALLAWHQVAKIKGSKKDKK